MTLTELADKIERLDGSGFDWYSVRDAALKGASHD